MRKRLLILRACGVAGEKQECDNIKTQAELYNIEVVDECPTSNLELEKILSQSGAFEYIYLSSHGDEEGFCNESRSVDVSWSQFSLYLCEFRCMNENCIVMLSCCRGGLHQVAYELLWSCAKVSYVVGPRQSLTPQDMLISFNILLYNLNCRGIDPVVACEKIKSATDIRFICFDRLETETDIGYIHYTGRLADQTVERLYSVLKPELYQITA